MPKKHAISFDIFRTIINNKAQSQLNLYLVNTQVPVDDSTSSVGEHTGRNRFAAFGCLKSWIQQKGDGFNLHGCCQERNQVSRAARLLFWTVVRVHLGSLLHTNVVALNYTSYFTLLLLFACLWYIIIYYYYSSLAILHNLKV